MAELFGVYHAKTDHGMGFSALLIDHRPLSFAIAHRLIKLVQNDPDQNSALQGAGGGMPELHTADHWDGLGKLIERILIHFPISLFLDIERPNPDLYIAQGRGPMVSTELASALSLKGNTLALAVEIRNDFFTGLNEISASDPLDFGHGDLALGKYYQALLVNNSLITDKYGNVLQRFTFYPWQATEKQNPVC